MRHVLSWVVVECGLVTVAVAAPPPGLSDDQQRRLDAGEVILLDALPPGAGQFAQGGTGIAVVRASPEAVWRVLVDYPGHSRLYPRVVGVEVLEAREGYALIRYAVGIGPFSFRFDIDKYPDRARRRIEWRLADGHSSTLFRENSGYWQVDAAEGVSLVTYAIAVRTILPAFLTRRSERESLVDTINALRMRVAERSAASAAPRRRAARR